MEPEFLPHQFTLECSSVLRAATNQPMMEAGRLCLNLEFINFLPEARDNLSRGWKMEIILALTMQFVVKRRERVCQVHSPSSTQNWCAQAEMSTLVISQIEKDDDEMDLLSPCQKPLSQVLQVDQLLLHRNIYLGFIYITWIETDGGNGETLRKTNILFSIFFHPSGPEDVMLCGDIYWFRWSMNSVISLWGKCSSNSRKGLRAPGKV